MSNMCLSSAQNCISMCCNEFGRCPLSSTDCYYFYGSSPAGQMAIPTIAGIAVGSLAFLYILAWTIFCVVRKQSLVKVL